MKPVIDNGDTGRIGIAPFREHATLGKVGVDVSAEEGGRDEQGCAPRDKNGHEGHGGDSVEAVRIVGSGEQVMAEDEPGLQDEGHSDKHQGACDQGASCRATQCFNGGKLQDARV